LIVSYLKVSVRKTHTVHFFTKFLHIDLFNANYQFLFYDKLNSWLVVVI